MCFAWVIRVLFFLLAMTLATPGWAEEKKEESITERPTTYIIWLTIKYDAVTEQQASDITKAALAAHGQEACQVEVKINKNDGNNIGILADTGLGDALLTLTETDAPSSFPITTK